MTCSTNVLQNKKRQVWRAVAILHLESIGMLVNYNNKYFVLNKLVSKQVHEVTCVWRLISRDSVIFEPVYL